MLAKLKELGKDTAIYGISTVLGRFLIFLLVPFYTNIFPTDLYGIAIFLYSLLAFMNIVYIYGMDSAYLKYASAAETSEEKKEIFNSSLIFISVTSFLFSSIIILFRFPVIDMLDLPAEFIDLIIYISIILFLDTITLIPFAKLRLERKTIKFASIKTINILINLTLNIVLIKYYDFGIEGIFISNLIASAFSFTALLPEIYQKLRISVDPVKLKKMLKFGLPYLPASTAAVMVQVIDVPILRSLSDDSTVGIYRANYKLGIFMMLFVQMFQYAWQPFFLNNAKNKDAKEIFAKVMTLFIIASGIIWLLLSLFIEEFAKIELFSGRTLIGKEYLGGLIIVPIILFAYIFHGIYVNLTAGIYIEEKTKYFPVITGIGAVSNIMSNFLLIPPYGLIGAAVSTLISYFLMAVGIYWVSQKFYKINYEYGKIFLTLILIIMFGVLYYVLHDAGLLNFHMRVLSAFMFFLLLFLMKIITPANVKTTIKELFKIKDK